MKKITLFLIMLGFCLTASAQYNFAPIVGPTNVASGTPVTINLNDIANATGVTASSTGSYDSFSITVDWVVGGGNPWSSEADLSVTTTAGSIIVNPPTAGGLDSNDNTTLTFAGDLPGIYDPTTDGYIDLLLNQSFGGSNADWSNIVVTLFESPTCIEPAGMASSGVTSDTAILDWLVGDSETSWNIEYNGGADFTPGNGEEENALTVTTTPNTTLTSLTPATTYYVYYQADCDANGLSLWVGPFTFDTECVTFTAPFTEDFENAGAIPLCWSMSGENWLFSDNAGGSHVGDNGTITGSTASNNFYAWSDASGDDGPRTLTSPFVDLSGLTTPALSFYEISDNEGNANSDLNIEVWDGAAWNDMGTFNTNTVGWELRIIDLGGLTITGDVQARFTFSETVTGDFYDDIAIDDVTFDEAPSCFNPSMLMANAITPNSAELSWTQGGTVSLWNIEIVPSGTAPTGTPTATDISNPYNANSLSAVTSYDYYVQANCGAELSGWAGPFTFVTLCDVFIPDYIENFTTVTATVPPDCWEEADSGDATSGPGDLGAGSWTADEFLNIGTGDGAYKINLFVASKSDWILSPLFDLTGGPFQVEFDFGIMEFGSDDTAGTLGSDDTVQLLMTNDSGATWINLLTYDNTSVVSPTGEHPVVDLTAYSGQTVQFGIFASEGTVNDPEDIDVFVDNFRVRNIPTCPEPTDLTATSIDLTSTEVGWTEAGTSSSWNIQYGETGFALGTGTIEADVTTNPFTLNGLTPDTSYEFYVQAICGPGNESSYAGPFEFFVGYCESIPGPLFDGTGVNNVTIGVTDFPSLGDNISYENQTSPVVNVFQGVDTTVEIEFGHTFTYDTNIWIDFNDDLVFDATELVFQGNSSGGNNPHLLDASFVMPLTAPIGEHRMRIGSADFGQATPDPCYNGNYGVTLDFTVNIQELTCTLPEADYTVVPDCDNDQFYIDVNVTSLGDATSLEISNNLDASTVQATTTDVYQAGPFPFGSTVKVFVTNEQDNNCVISSENFEVLACPPSNDDCEGAIPAVVNALSTCDEVTSGTILAATPSGVPNGTCTGSTNDDVWFTFEALNEVQIISILNVVGGTPNINHAIYEGSCGTLTQLDCSDDDASVTPALVVGNTYYIRVFSGGNQPETSTFDLCIRPAPSNIVCENAENFCSVDGSPLTTPNIIGIPSNGQVACLFTAPNPTWNIIQVSESGIIEIEINQQDANGNGLDVDFVIWGPFDSIEQACTDILLEDCPTCPNNTTNPNFYPFGNIVDCSYSAASVENLTIDNAQSGEIYMLLVTNFNGNPGDITIEQTNDNGGAIEAEITAEITSNEVVFVDTDSNPATPVEANVCGFDSVTIEADSPFADEFEWYKDGFVMAGETSSSIVVTESDNYQVRAIDNQCGAEAFSEIVIINLYTDPGNIVVNPISVCDSQTTTGEEFDLGEYTASLNLGAQFTVSYYTNTTDANQAINAVGPIYNSTGETLIMRIEDVNASNNGFLGCRSLVDLELIVGPDLCIFPQGISPGVSPGINDSFDLSNFDVTKLEIFNRNGTLVYSKKNYTNEWVGQTNDGKELPVGTYFYTMEYAGGTKVRSAWIYINK